MFYILRITGGVVRFSTSSCHITFWLCSPPYKSIIHVTSCLSFNWSNFFTIFIIQFIRIRYFPFVLPVFFYRSCWYLSYRHLEITWPLFYHIRLILELRLPSMLKEGLALNAIKAINNMLNYLFKKSQYTPPNMALHCKW